METAKTRPARRYRWTDFVLSWYGALIVYAVVIGLFLLLRGNGGNDPIFLKLGGLTFRWYGIIITSGVVVASFLAQFLAERRGDDPDHVWRILPVLLVSGIATARIWYVANTWENYKDYIFSINGTRPGVIEIWRGGIAIQGAVIGGIVGALAYGYIWNRIQKRKESDKPRFSIWRFADYVAPGLVLAQGIGRWGNFMNNEAYGRETKMGWGVKIPCEFRTTGGTPGTVDTSCTKIDKDALFHPTFLYESLWNYFTFLLLFYCIMKPKTIERRLKFRLRDGDIFLLYWVIYSIGRFFVEGLRTDSLYLNGDPNSLRTAQVTAIIGILVAGFLLFWRHRKSFPDAQKLSMRLAPYGASVAATTAVADKTEISKTAAIEVAKEVEAQEETELDSSETVEVKNKLDSSENIEEAEKATSPVTEEVEVKENNENPPEAKS